MSNSLKVQRLPFGFYLKTSPLEWYTSLSNEYEALDLLMCQTNVLVPDPLDLVSDARETVTCLHPGSLDYHLDSVSTC